MNDTTEHDRIDTEIHSATPGSDPFAAAMRATRMPMLITDPNQADNPIVFVNDAFAKLTGYSREETLGRNCRFLQGPGTNSEDIDRIRTAIAERQPIEIELLNYKKDGGVFWNRVLISPVFDRGELTYFFASQLDVTRERLGDPAVDSNGDDELRRRIADLTASEERLQFTLRAGGFGTWSLDVPKRRLTASAICKRNYGRGPADDFTYEDLMAAIHPDDFDRWRETLLAAWAAEGDFNVSYRVNLPDGTMRWVEIRGQTRFDEAHQPVSMSGVSIDITERKEAESYRALVTQEMSHRIKNTLATVQSIVSQSLRSDAPRQELVAVVNRRLEALSGAHDLVTATDWDVAGLRATIERAVKPFAEGGRITTAGPEMEIAHGVSSALTLSLHELATNALKYGALSNDAGSIDIHWSAEDGVFTLEWLEQGGPTVAPPERKGFGSRMIEQVLGATVKGVAEVDYRPEGLAFKLRAPVEGLAGN